MKNSLHYILETFALWLIPTKRRANTNRPGLFTAYLRDFNSPKRHN